MANNQLYGLLVPDAPLYRRTQGDEYQSLLSMARATTNRFLVDAAAIPGLQTPELVSSFSGSIEQILFCFPKWALQGVEYPQAYRSVISALRVGTKFVIVHHESTRPDIEPWFTSVGHKPENLLFVGLPGYVRPVLHSAAISPSTMAGDLIRALTAQHQIKPTTHCCQSAWQPIRRSDGVIALISASSSTSSGQKWEIECAREEGKSILAIWAYSDDRTTIFGLTVETWTWERIESFINGL